MRMVFMTQKTSSQMLDELYALFAMIDSPEDFRLLLDDLCTYKELEQMAGRIAAAKLFMKGQTYIRVNEQTSISSATLSRVNRCVKRGEGYKKILTKYCEEE